MVLATAICDVNLVGYNSSLAGSIIFIGVNFMRRFLLCALATCAFALLASTTASAGKWSATDFPLRVSIFQFNGHSRYAMGTLDAVDGEGRANLFENGEPRGFDFAYQCHIRLMGSDGYETFMARWKKPGRELEVLMPVLGGKASDMNTCNLKVTLKDGTAYYRRNGVLAVETSAQYKDWMSKHDYDPEHGKNQPTNLTPDRPAPPSNGAAQP